MVDGVTLCIGGTLGVLPFVVGVGLSARRRHGMFRRKVVLSRVGCQDEG
jgi:hypothetical protein